jgi:AraC-like DNA-binding protein
MRALRKGQAGAFNITRDIRGEARIVDGARPSTRRSENGAQWLSIYLLRQPLISHLGFEPQAWLCGCGETLAARVLRQLVLEGIEDDESTAAWSGRHMRLALYDLLGAVCGPSDPWLGSRHSEKLFARIRRIISDSFADPNFGPNGIATATGISLRYLQKLFTERNSTCSEFIYALRLDHAARLVHRRALLATNQPLSEIAYACGFRDYTHFARRFRHRFSNRRRHRPCCATTFDNGAAVPEARIAARTNQTGPAPGRPRISSADPAPEIIAARSGERSFALDKLLDQGPELVHLTDGDREHPVHLVAPDRRFLRLGLRASPVLRIGCVLRDTCREGKDSTQDLAELLVCGSFK